MGFVARAACHGRPWLPSPTVGRMSTSVRSLADDLRQRPDSQLVELLQLRGDLSHPLPADVGQLAARSTTFAATIRAIDRLDRFQLQVLEAVVVLPEPVDEAALVAAMPGVSVEQLAETIGALVTRALVWGAAGAWRATATTKEVLGPFPAGLGPSLADLRTTDDLPQLMARMDDLPPNAREVLDKLTWGPPTGSVDNATRLVDVASAGTAVEHLLARGLLVAADRRTVVLPREVALVLRAGRTHQEPQPCQPSIDPVFNAETAPSAAAVSQSAVDQAAAGSAFDMVRRVEDLLEAWALDPPGVLRSGGVAVREIRAASSRLHVTEATVTLMVEIAYAAGLVSNSGDTDDAWLPTPAYDVWRTQPMARRWTGLAHAWLETTRVPGLAGARDSKENRINALAAELDQVVAPDIRQAVLLDLASLSAGSTASVETLLDRQEWRRPRRGGRLRDDMVRWSVDEASMAGLVALGAMSTAGRAMVEDGDAAAAAAALGPLLPKQVDHVLLQADLTAIAPGPLDGDVARELGLFADIESSGGATVFRFCETSVRRALDAGRSAIDLHTFLAAHSRTPVPQPLSYLIDDVARRHGRIRVGAASAYVRSDDPAVLDELLADKRSAGLRPRRLAPTVVAVQAVPDVVLERLRQMGLSPAAESADGSVVIKRPDARRTGPRQRPPRLLADPPAPSALVAAAAVRALRSGERGNARSRAIVGPADDARPKTAVADTLDILKTAASSGQSVWLSYVGTDGVAADRVVDPVEIRGGWLTAFDQRVEQVRTFAVHRITGVAPLADSKTQTGRNGSR